MSEPCLAIGSCVVHYGFEMFVRGVVFQGGERVYILEDDKERIAFASEDEVEEVKCDAE
jgi:hypothetical protein